MPWGAKHIINYVPNQSLMLEYIYAYYVKHNQHAKHAKVWGLCGMYPRKILKITCSEVDNL